MFNESLHAQFGTYRASSTTNCSVSIWGWRYRLWRYLWIDAKQYESCIRAKTSLRDKCVRLNRGRTLLYGPSTCRRAKRANQLKFGKQNQTRYKITSNKFDNFAWVIVNMNFCLDWNTENWKNQRIGKRRITYRRRRPSGNRSKTFVTKQHRGACNDTPLSSRTMSIPNDKWRRNKSRTCELQYNRIEKHSKINQSLTGKSIDRSQTVITRKCRWIFRLTIVTFTHIKI